MVKKLKTRKDNRKRLITIADKLWADIIKARDGRCIYCGSSINLNAHHIFTKGRHGNLRWIVDNGVTLCAKCHTFGIHINPAPYMLKIIECCGMDRMSKLRERAKLKPAPLRIDDIKSIIDSLKLFQFGGVQ